MMAKKKSSESESGSTSVGSSSGGARNPDVAPHRLHLWQVQAIRDILVIAGGVFIVLIGYWLRSVTVPLLIALALAYLFEPLVEWTCRNRNWPRSSVVGGLIGILVLVVMILTVAVVPLLFVQTVQFAQSIRPNLTRIVASVEGLNPRVREPIEKSLGFKFESIRRILDSEAAPLMTDSDDSSASDDRDDHSSDAGTNGASTNREQDEDAVLSSDDAPDDQGEPGGEADDAEVIDPADKRIESWLRENLSSILQITVRSTGDAVTFIGRLIGSAIYLAFLLFLIPFYFFFFSTSWPHLRRFVRETLPPENFEDVYTLVEKMDLAISGFVRGRIVISAIMGVLLAIGWGICGVPYWMIVGLTTGVLCAVPYLGGAGLPLAIVLLWLGQGDLAPDQRMAWWGIILWPSVVFGVVQVIESYGLTPYIAGKATNLGPVSILVAVLAGGVVAGVYGMLLAIPVAACLKIVMTDALLPRVHLWARGQAQDILPIDEQY